jgi:hypothetical protein
MQENTFFYKTALSVWGAVSVAVFAAFVGAIWAAALNVDITLGAAVLAAVGAVWGAIAFQLTPTGGIVTENKTTVNYAVVALHGWMAAIAAFVAAVVLVIQQFV